MLYASFDHLAAKCLEHPTQPTWREGEVSAKLDEAGEGVQGGAGGGLIVGDAHSAQDPVDLMLFRIHRLDLERTVPTQRVFQIDHLPRRGLAIRHDAQGVRMPPFIPKCWLQEQFPDALNRGCDNCPWADGKSHRFSSFQRDGNAAQS
jgi:hypothetical protein